MRQLGGRWAGGLARKIDRGRADEAVAADKVMIEKGQRLVGCERCKPERQPGKLNSRRIQVDAEKATLRDLLV